MNSLIESEFPLRDTQNLRYELLTTLTDDDLTYRLPGDNPTLGELCREMGDLEHRYIESFTTRRHDWSGQHNEPDLTTSVERLTAWYTRMDDEFETVIRAFSEDDLHTTHIDRGHGAVVSAFVQFHIFREAVLMFCAKASVYLKALRKPMSDHWRVAVG